MKMIKEQLITSIKNRVRTLNNMKQIGIHPENRYQMLKNLNYFRLKLRGLKGIKR